MRRNKHYVNRFNKQEKITRFTVKESTLLFDFLHSSMPEKSRNAIKELLVNKQVRINDTVQTHFQFELNPGDLVAITNIKAAREITLKGLKIVYEDLDVIVAYKDHGLLSVSTNKENQKTAYRILSNYLKQADPKNQLFVVHRLDREASGLMLFAKSQEVKEFLLGDKNRTVLDRRYYVAVEGQVEKDHGAVHSWLKENKAFHVYTSPIPNGGQEAITNYVVLNRGKQFTLLEVKLDTGVKNQIRVQLQEIGNSVVGDKKYGATVNPIGRMALHAYLLTFKHPRTKEVMQFDTPIPPEFNKLINL